MSVIISLQGAMAVGKTSVVNYVKEKYPTVYISYENPYEVLRIIKEKKYDKNKLNDYIEIQRLFIQYEIERWKSFQNHKYVLTDFGYDEIEFHTLFYPKAMGYNWDIETHLKDDLKALRKCQLDYIIYLDNDEKSIRSNKEKDSTRSRNSFEFYMTKLYPYKKDWLLQKKNVLTVNCHGLTVQEQNESVAKQILSCFKITC